MFPAPKAWEMRMPAAIEMETKIVLKTYTEKHRHCE